MTSPRIPLNTFAIGFGLAGLAEAWSAAAPTLALPGWLPQVFWSIAAVAWLWLLTAHLVRGLRATQRLRDQLRHPAQGPLAALVPVIALLLGADLSRYAFTAGRIVVVVALVAAALFAGWLIGTWLQGDLELEAVHGGYLLPTVAAGLVGADAAAAVDLRLVGWAAFGVGVFFWVMMTTLIVLRIIVRPALPDALTPTLAILLAPPPVAGLAWFALAGPSAGAAPAALAGLGVVLALTQVALLPRYRRLTFSLGFWSFTFPAAAAAAFTFEWLEIETAPGRQAITAVLLIALTAFVGVLAVRSIQARTTALRTLTAANEKDAVPVVVR
ncbi:transporter [Actinoplanes sp. TRM 88003]|uniref:Transporter n=1 Tax=Paractinoplanes aksuensis TaxID=2939490 RepID=A0ABT1DSZ4_9ACTN|nr:transporter [Actinoplanes aksuensis]MCO8273962.1 transporter [Actinoplanes aksuensis]